MKLEIITTDTYLKIKINNLLHLYIKGKVTGVMSYMTSEENFFIEWHTKDKMVLTEYDKRGLWERILKLVDKTLSNGIR